MHKNDQYHQCVLDPENTETKKVSSAEEITSSFDCKLDETRSCKDPCDGKKKISLGQGKCSDHARSEAADLKTACLTLMGTGQNDGIMYRCRYDGSSDWCSASDVRCTSRPEEKKAVKNGTVALPKSPDKLPKPPPPKSPKHNQDQKTQNQERGGQALDKGK